MFVDQIYMKYILPLFNFEFNNFAEILPSIFFPLLMKRMFLLVMFSAALHVDPKIL